MNELMNKRILKSYTTEVKSNRDCTENIQKCV